jgi:hypothetical protein
MKEEPISGIELYKGSQAITDLSIVLDISEKEILEMLSDGIILTIKPVTPEHLYFLEEMKSIFNES